MSRDFLPSNDGDLLAWAERFSDKLTATPVLYGITVIQAAALAGVLTPFATALATATNPATRTRSAIEAKNDAKAPLKALIRDLARIINAARGRPTRCASTWA